jgi:hypothetical protein
MGGVMTERRIPTRERIWLAGLLMGGALIPAAQGQAKIAGQQPTAATDPASSQPAQGRKVSPYRSVGLTTHAKSHYELYWGVDSLEAKAVESGSMIRFSYYVIDPAKAALLNDKKTPATLYDPQAHVSLTVPSVEQVGLLRQSTTPEAGKAYWMIFANKRKEVKRGDRVSIVIGKFRADGLYVR